MLKSRFIVVCEPVRFEMMSLIDIAQEATAFAQGDKSLEVEYIRAALKKQRLIRTDSLEYQAMESQQMSNLEKQATERKQAGSLKHGMSTAKA